MLATLLSTGGNITSIILWLPQAKQTWKYRHNKQALAGLSYQTIVIGILNTLFWGANGLATHNLGLAFGTVFFLPTTLLTLLLKYRADNQKQERYYE